MEPSTSGSGSSVTVGAGGRSIRQSLRTKKAKVSFSPTLNNAASSSSSQTGGTGTRSGQGQQAEKNGPTKVNNNQTASAIGGLLGHASPNKTQTLRDLLASTQFSMKPRKRSNKRKSIAAQIAQTKEGCIDMTPDSILVNTNLKALLNYDTFNMLPAAYRYKLITLLPECDKLPDTENSLRSKSRAFFSICYPLTPAQSQIFITVVCYSTVSGMTSFDPGCINSCGCLVTFSLDRTQEAYQEVQKDTNFQEGLIIPC
ncbi:polycomb group protein ASXL1-like [Haliotis rufescens]|uniref:polycomb group protein ASXL1-like n=1 Tax=Haliotis rufescens TaxID=6454 RepID=UPI00201EAB6D|nr:polycomb group protein ASXL1-like [Haliotis rufescens]